MNLMNEKQLQSAKAVTRQIISTMEQDITECTQVIRKLYPMCNPDDPSTADLFKLMNKVQDERRYIRNKLKVFVAMQKQIKTDLVIIRDINRVKFSLAKVDASSTA